MRRGETLKLTWADVDFGGEQITARSRKQSRRQRESARQIDMHPMLHRELLAWRKRRSKGQFVVSAPESLEPLSPNQANRRFRQPLRGTQWCLDKAKGWYRISFHTYRHSFASNLAAEGVDQRVIDEFMGHQTEAMRKRYRHLFPNRRRDAISRLNLAGGANGAITAQSGRVTGEQREPGRDRAPESHRISNLFCPLPAQ